VPKSYRVIIVIEDLNRKVGTDPENGVMGMPGENDNGRRMKDMCNKRGLYVTNFVKHKNMHKYKGYRVNY